MLAAMRKCAVTLKILAHVQVVDQTLAANLTLGLWGVCVSGPFDIRELGAIKSAAGWGQWGWKFGRQPSENGC